MLRVHASQEKDSREVIICYPSLNTNIWGNIIMLCSETGSHDVIRLVNLKLPDAQCIDGAMGEVVNHSHAEGRISFNILSDGFVSVIEVMIRKLNRRKRTA